MLLRCYYFVTMAYKSKIRKIGNSLGILLPKELLEEMCVGEGDELSFDKASGTYKVTPSPAVDPEFERAMEVFRSVTDRYKNALRELAK
jgi:putative addiction module antidote